MIEEVTWMRKRDLHILTAGIYTYSADERFRVLHPENSNDWTLHIKFATLRDSGLYECQVNSDPKISRPVILNVIEGQLDDPAPYETPAADIRFPDYKFEYPDEEMLNPRRKHKKNKGRGRGRKGRLVESGSVLAITCVVRHPPHEAPEHILWFHGPTNVDYDSARGGVSIQTEKSTRRTVSKLMLSAVSEADTGEYTCSPTSLQPAVLTVHVQDSQLQQPVKQDPAGISRAATEMVPLHITFTFLLATLTFTYIHGFA
ncbi:hypothetical protein Pmani_015994 [Petrolisthes manimaculis]|uniref:Ig-like domain-containing protein n=1 Tax=Petrolisthes manimaculis TaxID=1843537 RepID=A0AAE1PSP1_9EUCA|nr:hypothetical protein Pmani_015994 [Petrolisthes manimaculis]